MKFIIHTKKLLNKAIALESELGQSCYIPGRDTDQTQSGEKILHDNLEGMLLCDDDVHVIWDGESFGTMFDMGMAYALGKVIYPHSLTGGQRWRDFFRQNIGGIITHK